MNPRQLEVEVECQIGEEICRDPEPDWNGARGWSADLIAPGLHSEAGLTLHRPHIHSTNIKTFALCPRRFLFAHRLGLVRKGFARPLAMGQLFHHIMRELCLGASEGEVRDTARQLIQDELASLPASVPGGQTLREIESAAESDLQKALAMALAFWKTNPLDSSEWEVVAVEQEVLLRAHHPAIRVPISIQLDLLLRHRASGAGWIVDYKTTSLSPSRRGRMMAFDVQTRLYRFGAVYAYPDLTITGAILSIVRKPTIKFCAKDVDFDAYIQRVSEWYDTQRTKDPNDPPYTAPHVRFSEPVLPDELLGQLRATSGAICRAPMLRDFPRTANTEQICDGKYGACPFAELCTSSPSAWCILIPDLYRQVDRDGGLRPHPAPKTFLENPLPVVS